MRSREDTDARERQPARSRAIDAVPVSARVQPTVVLLPLLMAATAGLALTGAGILRRRSRPQR